MTIKTAYKLLRIKLKNKKTIEGNKRIKEMIIKYLRKGHGGGENRYR